MQAKKYTIAGGIYLVIDPAMESSFLFHQLQKALTSNKITVVQIWNHWKNVPDKPAVIEKICEMVHGYQIPVMMNADWELLKVFPLDGVHFDAQPDDLDLIRSSIGRPFLTGVTVSNHLDLVKWADAQQMDYISFCSVFPSSSAGSCELVSTQTLQKARQLTPLPIFVSGGITPENLHQLPADAFDGIAVISGIMKQSAPETSANNYYKALSEIKLSNE